MQIVWPGVIIHGSSAAGARAGAAGLVGVANDSDEAGAGVAVSAEAGGVGSSGRIVESSGATTLATGLGLSVLTLTLLGESFFWVSR